jgi:hypothetical protein
VRFRCFIKGVVFSTSHTTASELPRERYRCCQSRFDFTATNQTADCYISVLVRTTLTLLCLAPPLLLHSQSSADDSPDPIGAIRSDSPISNDRILGVIPNFQTVSDPATPYAPLRARDKWKLFVKESVDPFAFFSAAAGAGISQWHDEDPKYGVGFKPYMQRFGAAQADLTSQNFFQDAVLATLFHEDPRYFRRGPGNSVLHRIVYAVSRVAITRRDSGKDGFNFSGLAGMEMGIALSNAYYPARSVNGREMAYRTSSSLTASALGNLLPEFWPDIKALLARHKHK